jgi:hypothetical protein
LPQCTLSQPKNSLALSSIRTRLPPPDHGMMLAFVKIRSILRI